jgi:hypothetical protein
MYKFTVKAAITTPQHEALLFFALTLNEQLFDLTDDSFKAPALNTFSRTLELQSVASANHAAGIGKDALIPFIDELEWSVSKDPVIDHQQKALCKLHLTSLRDNLNEPDRIVRGVSGLRTVLGNYFEAVVEKIKLVIDKNPNDKLVITALAAIFIVQAETIGFPRRHTYHITQNTLISRLRNKEIFDPNTLLEKFFSHFPTKKKEFSCIFIAEGEFNRFPNLLSKFGITASTTSPTWENIKSNQKNFLESRNENQHFLLIDKINARSPAQAHQIAVDIFDEFFGVVRFFEHRLTFKSSSLSLVREKTANTIYTIHDAPDPMHCWVSHTSANENEMLEFAETTHGKWMSDASANKLRRTLRLHRSALRSNSAENQLIDLWAGLEGLVSRPGRESQRLTFFADCLLPALILTYPEKLFISAYRDLSKAAPGALAIANNLKGEDSNFSKFVRIILCSDVNDEREEFINSLKQFPLLLNKTWRLSEMFKNRTSTQRTLRRHRQKVAWHLARIYHTRNSIMHSATALPHLPTLVENLHVYIDTLVKAIQKTARISPERITIDGALQYLQVWERYRLHAITHDGVDNDAKPRSDDVWSIVFGDKLALTPKQNIEPDLR